MKVLSIDIETSGFDPEAHQILQIGLVLFDSEKHFKVEHCPTLNIFVDQPNIIISAETIDFHNGSFFWYRYNNAERIQEKSVVYEINTWLILNGIDLHEKINLAGKNLAMFDLPFLKKLKGFKHISYHRRIIDPAILFVDKNDEHLPDLNTCLSRKGINSKVTHDAVDDAKDVVKLLMGVL